MALATGTHDLFVLASPPRGARNALGIFLSSCLSIAGCGADDSDDYDYVADTCTEGTTMSSPFISEGFDASIEQPVLTIAWETGEGPGALLPSTYFEAVKLVQAELDEQDEEDDTTLSSGTPATSAEVAALITAIAYLEPRQLQLTFADLASYLTEHQQLSFVLEFPDRKSFIDCTHPGMADVYILEVGLTFDAGFTVVSTSFTEHVIYGAI